MDTKEIIAQIDSEIARLQQVKSILLGSTTTTTVKAKRGPKPKTRADSHHGEEAHPLARSKGKNCRRPKGSLGEG